MPRTLKTSREVAAKHFGSPRRGPLTREQIEQCVVESAGEAITIDLDRIDALSRRPIIENRPAPTLNQVKSFVRAATSGKYVPDDVRLQREAACGTCDMQRIDVDGVPWCKACGCGTSNAERQIRNLAAYEESLPHWGCKHPKRKQGKGWPLPVLPGSCCGGSCRK